jgi:hypothetical protein
VSQSIEPAVLGGHEVFGDVADEGMRQDKLQRSGLNRNVGTCQFGQREAIGEGRGSLLRIPFFCHPDQDAVDVLEHQNFPLSVETKLTLPSSFKPVLHQGSERRRLANVPTTDHPELISRGMKCKSAFAGTASEQRIIAQVLMRYGDLRDKAAASVKLN